MNITLSPPVLSGIEWHEVLTGKWTVTIAEAPRYTRLGGPSTLRGVPTVGLVRAAPPPSTRRHIRLLIEEAFAKLPKRRKKERKASRLIHSPAGLAVREETDRNTRSLCLCDPVGCHRGTGAMHAARGLDNCQSAGVQAEALLCSANLIVPQFRPTCSGVANF